MNQDLTVKQDSQLPAFLQDEGELQGSGLEDMTEFIIPPRLKIIQKNAQPPYDTLFNPGDTVVIPQNLKICSIEESFIFTPIFAFSEFCIVNPFQMRATLPMIRERTMDRRSEIAKKCKNMERMPCPESPNEECSYKTFLNFLVIVHGSELGMVPVLMSFSGGEYKYGSSAIGLMQMRGKKFYCCNFNAQVNTHENPQNRWFGWDISNPPASPWVEDENFFKYCKRHNEEMTASKELLQADYTDEDTTPPTVETANTGQFG